MINLQISDDFKNQVVLAILEKAALAALGQQQAPNDSDLSVVVEIDARLQELNNEFLGIDSPTDVLSFPTGDEEIDPETGRVYLGDIIISYPRALEQAAAAGHAVMDEMQLLVVHGVLHLLGHDHAEEEEKSQMWAAQNEILRVLDVHLNRLPE
jgi:probable rRNA maturation factor